MDQYFKIRAVLEDSIPDYQHQLDESSVTGCRICGLESNGQALTKAGKKCMFCDNYEICKACFEFLDNLPGDFLRASTNHPQHDLMLVGTANDFRPYNPKQEVGCSKCNEILPPVLRPG